MVVVPDAPASTLTALLVRDRIPQQRGAGPSRRRSAAETDALEDDDSGGLLRATADSVDSS